MKVIVRVQESYSVPAICCSCGAANPTLKYKPSKEARGFSMKARVKLTFMRCQACLDEAKSIRRKLVFSTFPAPGNPTLLRGVGIGGGIGVLVGAGILLATFLSTGELFSAGEAGDILNGVIGPAAACLLTPAALGAAAGLGIGSAILSTKRTPPAPNSRSAFQQRLRGLQFPVEILQLGFTEGFFQVKDPLLVLKFANDPYGRLFSRLNGGLLASYYCSKCGQEIDPDQNVLVTNGWCASCGKLYCPACLQGSWRKRCPDCGKPTHSVHLKELVQRGLVKVT